MILDFVRLLREMLEDFAPGAVFECDQARMLNVKVDTMARYLTDEDGQIKYDKNGNPISSTFVYIEEPTQSYYAIPRVGFQTQRTTLGIYFCKFEPLANDAYKGDTPFSQQSRTTSRLELKDQIEEELVRPFLYRLRASRIGATFPGNLENIRVLYPSARFDANEVSVGLEITIQQQWCIDSYKR